jgi:hypothetical protein
MKTKKTTSARAWIARHEIFARKVLFDCMRSYIEIRTARACIQELESMKKERAKEYCAPIEKRKAISYSYSIAIGNARYLLRYENATQDWRAFRMRFRIPKCIASALGIPRGYFVSYEIENEQERAAIIRAAFPVTR